MSARSDEQHLPTTTEAGLPLHPAPAELGSVPATATSAGEPGAIRLVDPLELSAHPAAAIFPMLPEPELAALVACIERQGQLEPAVHSDRYLIDGRNRAEACRRLGRSLRVRDLTPDDGEPIQFLLGVNLHRRHLRGSQRALAASRLASLDGPREGDQPPFGGQGFTQRQAANLFNVSERNVQRAAQVLRRSPKLADLVDQGLGLEPAAQVTRLADDELASVIQRGVAAVREAAASLRRPRKPSLPLRHEVGVVWPSAAQPSAVTGEIVDLLKGTPALKGSGGRALLDLLARLLRDPPTEEQVEALHRVIEGGLAGSRTDPLGEPAAPGPPVAVDASI